MAYLPVSVLGDPCGHGGGGISSSADIADRTFFGGVKISVMGGGHECCALFCHSSSPQTQAGNKCIIQGRKVVRVGDGRSCGSVIDGPSRNLYIGD